MPSWLSRSAAGTSSPVSTIAPSANRSVNPDRSSPASRARNVSARATLSRWSSTSRSRPSSPISNSSLPSSVGTHRRHVADAGHGLGVAARADRRRADAAMPSVAAIENRAETPERWSTEDELAQAAG